MATGQDREVSLAGVGAISSMVAPVVLITMGALVANGLLFASTGLHNRMWDLAREEFDIRTGPHGELLDATTVPSVGRARLAEIERERPLILRRHQLLQRALMLIYAGIAVLVLSVITIGVAVKSDSQAGGSVALSLVLAGTIGEFAGVVTVGRSVAMADPAAEAVEVTRKLP